MATAPRSDSLLGRTSRAAPPEYRTSEYLVRLHRAEGQVRGVTRMVADGRNCIEVLTQISAVTRALQEVAVGLLDDYIRSCAKDATPVGPDEDEARFEEIATALRRTLRL